jgi:phospholipid/cholesterol/gamma-HCH transport system ATP-binding protein
MPTDKIIRLRGLHKQFGKQVIFDNLDLDVYRGEILGVVGASGTGKSVLMRCITGLLKPEAGTVDVLGNNMLRLGDRQRFEISAKWGILFQDGALFSALTALQNIQVPMREHSNLSTDLLEELALLKLRMVGLDDHAAHKFPSQLSGGMRKRVGLARALALDPEIVFLDEPTSGLDPVGASAFDKLIKKLQKTLGLSVYMVTHDLDSLFSVCDRVAVLADRKIVKTGPPMELRNNPEHPWVEEYFCGDRAHAVVGVQV